MQQVLDESLVKITKGAGIAFLGSIVGLLLGFLSRVLVARHGTASDYGIFSLALVVLNLCGIIATLGLQNGASRSIAYSWNRNETEKVQDIISASVWFVLVSSLILSFVLFLASAPIAETVLHEPGLTGALKIFALAIPFFALINLFVAIPLGFQLVKPKVYFHDVVRNVFLCLLLLLIVALRAPFQGVFYAYLVSLIVPCVLLIVYAVKRLPSPVSLAIRASTRPAARELFFFSLPLLGVTALGLMLAWTDTLMLGYFKTSTQVGIYNAAHPLAQFISSPLNALVIVYLPATAGLYAQGLTFEMRKNLSVLTKWLCSATLPLFLFLFLFPEASLNFLFGVQYIEAANALRILSLGFMLNNFLGLAGSTLIAMGRSQFMMWASLAVVILNIGLNIALIPPFGIEGAAIATVVARTSVNIVRCWRLYSLNKAQPLSKNLVKPVLVSSGLLLLIGFVFGNLVTIAVWMLPLLLILFYVVYGLAMLLTRSIDREDITALLSIERRAGLNLGAIKRILRRFV